MEVQIQHCSNSMNGEPNTTSSWAKQLIEDIMGALFPSHAHVGPQIGCTGVVCSFLGSYWWSHVVSFGLIGGLLCSDQILVYYVVRPSQGFV